MIEAQLLLGLAAVIAWAGAGIRILRGADLGERGQTAVGVCIAATLVILVFGSLFILRIADQGVWFVTGSGLRLVVAVAGLVALVDQGPPSSDQYVRIAEELRSQRSDSYANLAGAIAENTALTQRASDNADRAHAAANTVRDELTSQGETIIAQGEAAEDARYIGQDTNDTAHRIDERLP